MKIIFENKYIKQYRFNNETEYRTFINNQDCNKKLILESLGKEFWYCYVGHDSLTSEKLFIISFNSDLSQDNLFFLYWGKSNLIVFDDGNKVFIIDENMKIIVTHAVVTALIGFHITESNYLLILEEATMKLLTSNGTVFKTEHFDLLEDYHIKDVQLHITTNNATKIIPL